MDLRGEGCADMTWSHLGSGSSSVARFLVTDKFVLNRKKLLMYEIRGFHGCENVYSLLGCSIIYKAIWCHYLKFWTTSLLSWTLSVAVFLKLPATTDPYMGSQCTHRPLSYHNIPFSHREHAIVLSFANRRKIIVKVAINHFPLSTSFK
jgi:hypothetical protein